MPSFSDMKKSGQLISESWDQILKAQNLELIRPNKGKKEGPTHINVKNKQNCREKKDQRL